MDKPYDLIESLKTLATTRIYTSIRQRSQEEIQSRQESLAIDANSIPDFLNQERTKGEIRGLSFDPLAALIEDLEKAAKEPEGR